MLFLLLSSFLLIRSSFTYTDKFLDFACGILQRKSIYKKNTKPWRALKRKHSREICAWKKSVSNAVTMIYSNQSALCIFLLYFVGVKGSVCFHQLT